MFGVATMIALKKFVELCTGISNSELQVPTLVKTDAHDEAAERCAGGMYLGPTPHKQPCSVLSSYPIFHSNMQLCSRPVHSDASGVAARSPD